MKKISKLLSILLCLAMLLSFVPVIASAATAPLAEFTFGTGTNGAWTDGNDMASGTHYTSGSYTLTFTDCDKVYSGGNDANNTGFIKFGTGSKTGTLTFTVPAEVTSVVLRLAGYKGNTSKFTINGGAVQVLTQKGVTTAGAATTTYDEITIDTSSNKTVTIATDSGGKRMVMFSILFYGGSNCPHTYDDCEDTTCNKGCGFTREAPGHNYSTCDSLVCTACGGSRATGGSHTYSDGYDADCNNCGAIRNVTLPLADAINMGLAKESDTYTSDKYIVTGQVVEVYNTQYGNMRIKDAAGNILTIYGSYSADGSTRYDAMTDKPDAGDTVTIFGKIGQFKGTAQIKNGWILSYVEGVSCQHVDANNDYVCDKTECGLAVPPAADTQLTLDKAIALGNAYSSNSYTPDKYYVEGVISRFAEGENALMYGNFYIVDANGNELYIYGLYSSDGQTRFDAMTDAPQVGDTVKLYGVIGNFSGAQMKSAWLVSKTAHTCDNAGATCTTPGACSKCGTAGSVLGHNWSTTYSKNGTHHWKDCLRDGCTAKNEEAAHTYTGATCTVPGTCVCSATGAVDPNAHTKAEGTNVCVGCGKSLCAECTDAAGDGNHNCDACGATNASAHTLVPTAAKNPTCTEAGNNLYYSCSECGGVFKDAQGTVPTTAEAEKITAAGHSLTKVPAKSATTSAEGNKEHWVCSTCSKLFSDAQGLNETTKAAVTIAKLTPSSSTTYTKVNSLADITAGGQYVIVAEYNGKYYVMSTTVGSNGKLTATEITVNGNTLSGTDLPIWTIAPMDGGVSLKAGSSFLKYKKSTNVETSDAAYLWNVQASAANDGTFKLIPVDADTRGLSFRMNKEEPMFGTYALSNETNEYFAEYTMNLMFFKVSTGSVPSVPSGPSDTSDSTISVVVAGLLVSAMGTAVLISKKKEF